MRGSGACGAARRKLDEAAEKLDVIMALTFSYITGCCGPPARICMRTRACKCGAACTALFYRRAPKDGRALWQV